MKILLGTCACIFYVSDNVMTRVHLANNILLHIIIVDVICRFWRLGTRAEYETPRRTIGRDDSYPVLGRSEP